ncbi:hypothetical protein GQ53DRAFT_177771 [Thozetella sp. PMI_491]|nr:hypothetical protein GQ53DRAFT_177771 [Thozetella sp. PMI_491]
MWLPHHPPARIARPSVLVFGVGVLLPIGREVPACQVLKGRVCQVRARLTLFDLFVPLGKHPSGGRMRVAIPVPGLGVLPAVSVGYVILGWDGEGPPRRRGGHPTWPFGLELGWKPSWSPALLPIEGRVTAAAESLEPSRGAMPRQSSPHFVPLQSCRRLLIGFPGRGSVLRSSPYWPCSRETRVAVCTNTTPGRIFFFFPCVKKRLRGNWRRALQNGIEAANKKCERRKWEGGKQMKGKEDREGEKESETKGRWAGRAI